eukprot:4639563-Pyramimonas_sp.AAC.1
MAMLVGYKGEGAGVYLCASEDLLEGVSAQLDCRVLVQPHGLLLRVGVLQQQRLHRGEVGGHADHL